MKLGVLVSTFQARAEPALEGAVQAEQVGFSGVFCYDHQWPLGEPGAPALSAYPMLGALAALTSRVRLGTLVARIGIEPAIVSIDKLASIDSLSGGRMIAGIGTGDRQSAPEHVAFGLPYGTASERRTTLRQVAEALIDAGIETWIGGGSPATNALAWDLGATLNLWAASPDKVAEAAARGPVSWGGTLALATAEEEIRAIAEAGATWAVATWPRDLAALVAAGRAAGLA